MNASIQQMARYWAENPVFDSNTRQEVQTLLDQNNENELQERFGQSLEFGTGGMRGIMGAGINRMNVYTVRQATEGLARYIEKYPDPVKKGVVIGYDSRHNSFHFAAVASEVLAAHGIPVYLFQNISPTPLTSFVVLQKNAVAGVMITASHNPPEYNGYKVYWKTGGQVIPPDDEGIIREVRQATDIAAIPFLPLAEGLRSGLVKWVGVEADAEYLNVVLPQATGEASENAKVGVIYTPLHGTGGRLVPALLRQRGFQRVLELPEQSKPDGNFSTVKSPNPEDGKAMEMAVNFSGPEDDLILANDPDADRLGVMVRHQGQWQRLNGNQIGVLLLDYYLNHLKQSQNLPANGYFVMSVVTSPMASKVAHAHGLNTEETLTGFKWIWDAAKRMEQSGTGTYVFGMEESHGYLIGNYCGDKDGLWAAMAFAEMTAYLKARGKSVMDRLNELYAQFGFHLDTQENQTLPGLDGLQKMQALMNSLRQNPPASLGGKRVLQVADLQRTVIVKPGSAEVQPGLPLPKSDVLIFELEGQARMIVRPSGTEPKVKYYFNLQGPDEATLLAELQKIKTDILK